MKKLVLLWLIILAPIEVLAVDSFKFTERLVDTVGAADIKTTVSASIGASFTLANPTAISFADTNTVWSFNINGFGAEGTIAVAHPRTATSFTIPFKNSAEKQVGTVTFARVGSMLNFTANFTDLMPNSIVTRSLTAGNGVEAHAFEFTIAVGSARFTGTAFYKATKTSTPGAGGTTLRNYSVAGEMDTTKPTITITSPTANQRLLTDPPYLLTGKTADTYGVREVRVYVGTERVGESSNIASNGVWQAQINALDAGPQTISVEGVDLAGNVSARATVKVTRVVTAPLNLAVDAGGTVTGATNAQRLELGKSYTLRAMPKAGFIFDGWVSATATNMNPSLTFTMTNGLSLHAAFGTNIYSVLNGTMAGLFRPDPLESPVLGMPTNSGYFTISLTANGGASGKIVMAGTTLPFSGAVFDSHGFGQFLVKRTGKTPLSVMLSVGVVWGVPTGFGLVSDGTFESPLRVDLMHRANHSFDGYYTFAAVPGSASGLQRDPAVVPLGYGFGTVTIAFGVVQVTVNLPDGTSFITSTALGYRATDFGARVPIYASLQGGKGMYIGWLLFTPSVTPIQSVKGDTSNTRPYPFTWTKAPSATGYYTNGFTNMLQEIYGTLYVAPSPGQVAFQSTNVFVKFQYGNLKSNVVTSAVASRTSIGLTNNLLQARIQLNPNTGAVTGTFKHPDTELTTKINAVVVRNPIGFVFGYFLGTNQAGYFAVDPEGIFEGN